MGNLSCGRRRRGFTFIELLMVMTILAIVFALGFRGMASAFSGNARQSATREVSAYLFRARAAAIRRSRQVWLVRSGNTIKILVDSSGTKAQLGTTLDVSARHGATLSVTRDTIASFDQRGFIQLQSPNSLVIVVRGSVADTLCISGLGNTRARNCS
jgi:prepilin-type N-terminal cleavage/methylation domain-containing protein